MKKLLSPKDEDDREVMRCHSRAVTTEDLADSEVRIELMLLRAARGTHEHIRESEQRIIAALGSTLDPDKLKVLTEHLKASAGSLKAAVQSNQPK